MQYWHLDVLCEGVATIEVTKSHAKDVCAKMMRSTRQHVHQSVETAMHADFLGGGFGIGISLKAAYARSAISASEHHESFAERMASEEVGTYQIREGETLAMVTLIECDKINNRRNSNDVDDGNEACFHTVATKPAIYKLSSDAVKNLLTTYPRVVFDLSWKLRLGTWKIKAECLSTREIEDLTTLKIYARPKLIVHSVGSTVGRDAGWVDVLPGMFISVRSGCFVDTIHLGNTRWGGTGGSEHNFEPACDQVITTIGGRSGWVLDRVYFGLSPEGGHDNIISRGIGGDGGVEFCWNPEKVGRIYRIGAHTNWYQGYDVISELRIESTM
ncbi:unnamed protein product [Pylaiella littoralis]